MSSGAKKFGEPLLIFMKWVQKLQHEEQPAMTSQKLTTTTTSSSSGQQQQQQQQQQQMTGNDFWRRVVGRTATRFHKLSIRHHVGETKISNLYIQMLIQ